MQITKYRFPGYTAYVRKQHGHILFHHHPSATFGSCPLRPMDAIGCDTQEWVKMQHSEGNFTRLTPDQFQNYLRG